MEGNRRRKQTRLAGYDYRTPGVYFVTLVTHGRECLFGRVVEEGLVLNDLGRVAEDVWTNLPDHYPHLELDAFVVMPNHFHGLVFLKPNLAYMVLGRSIRCLL